MDNTNLLDYWWFWVPMLFVVQLAASWFYDQLRKWGEPDIKCDLCHNVPRKRKGSTSPALRRTFDMKYWGCDNCRKVYREEHGYQRKGGGNNS